MAHWLGTGHCGQRLGTSDLSGSGVVSPQKWCVFSSNIFDIFRLIRTLYHVDSLIRTSRTARCTSGSLVNVEKEPKSTFAAPLAASPWARAAPSRARAPYQPPPALGSRPASSAGFSCWAARQQELDLRHVQRVVTAPLWLPSFGARDGNDPRHPLHRVGVLGSGGRHSPATSVGCPSLATVGVPSSRLLGAAHSEDFMICVCI